jgi:hypothetical protein
MPTRTELLSAATTAADSSTFVVDAGAPATVHLKGASGAAIDANEAVVLERFDGTNYSYVADVTPPGITVSGIGTYRVRREVQATAVGADVEK